MTVIGEQPSGMYSKVPRGAGKKATTALEVSGEMLLVWYLQLTHANRTAIKVMMKIKEVIKLVKLDLQPTKSCEPCFEGTMPNTALRSKTSLGTRPRLAPHTDVAEMKVIPVSGACYSVMSIETSKHVSAFHIKRKAETAKLLKCQTKRFEMQTENKMRKITLEGGKEYLKSCTELSDDAICISNTDYFTLEENERAERMNCSVKARCETREDVLMFIP